MIENTQTALRRSLGYIGRLCLYEFLPAQRKMQLFQESDLQIMFQSLQKHCLAFFNIRSSFIVKKALGIDVESFSIPNFFQIFTQRPALRGFFIGVTSVGLGMLIVKIV